MLASEFLESSEIEGRVVVLLNSIAPTTLEDFFIKAKEDFLYKDSTPSNKYISKHLKLYKKVVHSIPSLLDSDLEDPLFFEKYKVRFNRLKVLSESVYHYNIEHTTLPLRQIIEFSERNKVSRTLVFHVDNLVKVYSRILKIFNLNSFLNYRYSNYLNLPNIFVPTGFIRDKTVDFLFQGIGKSVNDHTFKAIELELDKEFCSNISYIKTGTA
ncbi:MAG: hypothetical protein AAF518_16200 [Spirochaetota bacterium]